MCQGEKEQETEKPKSGRITLEWFHLFISYDSEQCTWRVHVCGEMARPGGDNGAVRVRVSPVGTKCL